LYGGLNESIFTDSLQMILKKEAAKKALNKAAEKIIAKERKRLMTWDGLSWKEATVKAQEIIKKKRKEYKGKFPAYKQVIPKKL